MQDTPTEIFPVLSQQVNMLSREIHPHRYSQCCHNRSTCCDPRYTHTNIPSGVTTGQHVVMQDILHRYSQCYHNRSTSHNAKYAYTDIPSAVTTGQHVTQDTPTQIFPVLSQQVNKLWRKIPPHRYSQCYPKRSTLKHQHHLHDRTGYLWSCSYCLSFTHRRLPRCSTNDCAG